MLEAARELLDRRLRKKTSAASVCTVIPILYMRTSRKGTQVKMTQPPGLKSLTLLHIGQKLMKVM